MPLWAVITTICISAGSVVGAVLFHAIMTVRWGTRIEVSMNYLQIELVRIGKELERRDDQIAALWKRVDQIRDLIPLEKTHGN